MSDQDTIHKIEQTLSTIRPNIQMDGGDIEFVNFEDGVVYVRLLGACVGCPSAIYTVAFGVEEALKDNVSQVERVVLVD